jgi:hypothetical protein
MAIAPTLEQYTLQTSQTNLLNIVLGLVLAVIFSYILGKIYVKYGTSISNREKFANNFILLAMVTTLVISVVKSSLALSLGLVGALSIVRFRAAIKEPEELVYLFLIIGMGLGLGASQWALTSISFVLISSTLVLRSRYKSDSSLKGLSLLITLPQVKENMFSKLRQILSKNCKSVNLKRYDEDKDNVEALFYVEFLNINNLEVLKQDLKSLSSAVQISLLDNTL